MSRAVNVGCRNLVTVKSIPDSIRRASAEVLVKSPTPQKVPAPKYRQIESSYTSNRWVATLPLTPEEEDTLMIREENRVVTISGNFWAKDWKQDVPLPRDAIPESVLARTSRGMLFITAELEEPFMSGKEVPIIKMSNY